MLTTLYDKGRLDILRALKDRQLSVNEVYAAKLAGRLSFVATDVVLYRPLWDAVEAWKPTSAPAPKSRKRYAVSFGQIERVGVLSDSAKVRDLATVPWAELSESWEGGPADWNRLRSAVSRFLSMTLHDKYHPFRRQVMGVFPRQQEPPGRVPDVTPALFWTIVGKAREVVRPCYVTLVATGLRLGEYMACREEHLLPHTLSLRVPGTKTASSAATIRVDERLWPWVRAAIPPPVSEKYVRNWWKEACAAAGVEDLRLHDLRHCTGQWLTDAGRPEASVQQTLRHADPAMTRRYTRQRDRGEDATAMANILLPDAPTPKVVRKRA